MCEQMFLFVFPCLCHNSKHQLSDAGLVTELLQPMSYALFKGLTYRVTHKCFLEISVSSP